jgi:hypothetical protein
MAVVSAEVEALGQAYREAGKALHAAIRMEILNGALIHAFRAVAEHVGSVIELSMKRNQTGSGAFLAHLRCSRAGLTLLKEPLLMAQRPAYYLLRSNDPAQPPCILVAFLPDGISVKERMLYAASQSILHQHFSGVIARDFHCTSIVFYRNCKNRCLFCVE